MTKTHGPDSSVPPDLDYVLAHEDVARLIKQYGIKTFVEVGVYYGRCAEFILTNCEIEQYYCVDPWEVGSNGLERFSAQAMNHVYLECCRRLMRFKNVEIIRAKSILAAEKFKDKSVDCVYIDGSHADADVIADILLWSKKAKKLLIGDDYDICAGVQRAIAKLQLDVHIIRDGKHSTWVCEKFDNLTIKEETITPTSEKEKSEKMKPNSHHQVLEKVLLEHFGREAEVVGIDIGTYCGDSARLMLWTLPKAKVFTIDPWIHNPGHEFEAGEPQSYHNGNKELALQKFSAEDIKDRVTVLEMTSEEAHRHITQVLGIEKVDFVWIDGNHEPDAVAKDIELFFPMVKEGGLFGGHDFGQIWPLTQIIFNRFPGKLWSGPDFAWWVYREQVQ